MNGSSGALKLLELGLGFMEGILHSLVASHWQLRVRIRDPPKGTGFGVFFVVVLFPLCNKPIKQQSK